MTAAMLLISALVLIGSAVVLEAADVLGAQQTGQHISKEVVGHILKSASSSRLLNITEELRPTFAALPKNQHGRLEPSTVRYVVHRYFVQKHAWYVKGLDPEGDGWTGSSALPSDDIAKGRAPVYIQEYFATRFHDSGLEISDLAVFVATVSDLVFQESLGHLRRVYEKLGLSTSDPVEVSSFDVAVRAFLAELITQDLGKFTSQSDFPELEAQAKSFYTQYDDHVKLLRNLYPRDKFVYGDVSGSVRPGLRLQRQAQAVSFEVVVGFLHEFLHSFRTAIAAECHEFKKDLMDMEQAGTGRVLLSDYYANPKMQLRESVGYLRNLGVYEEEEGTPRLLIANLITSPSRCIPFSDYSTVCCPDECHVLLGHLEHHVGQPSPPLARLLDLLPMLPSDTVDAPRSFSALLLARLHDIAGRHGGRVPLHSRLFMQWMHYAYPRECPYPHVAGTTKPASQDEWMLKHEEIDTVDATPVEMARVLAESKDNKPIRFEDLPWSNAEELLATDASDFNYSVECLRAVFAFAALLSIGSTLVGLARRTVRAAPASSKLMAVV